MFRFMQRFGRDSHSRWCGNAAMTRVRRRNHPLNCEALEGRQLLAGYYIVNVASGKALDDKLADLNRGPSVEELRIKIPAPQMEECFEVRGFLFRVRADHKYSGCEIRLLLVARLEALAIRVCDSMPEVRIDEMRE